MVPTNSSLLRFLFAITLGLAPLTGCVVETRPTLNEARIGRGFDKVGSGPTLQPGEIGAEVIEVLPARNEVRVRTTDGRDRIMIYNPNRTHVTYHGWDYTVDNLEPGDLIAFRTTPQSSNYIDSIRIQEPMQARAGLLASGTRPLPSSARANMIDGTVERIQYDLGVFDVRVRPGELVTVSLPYNARAADVESFRRLRPGDRVRLEGEFVNRDNLQLYSFISPR